LGAAVIACIRDCLDQFDGDEELWLQVAGEIVFNAFASFYRSSLGYDRAFLLQAVRANPERCLDFLTHDQLLDFDLILAACATKAEFSDTLVDRCHSLLEPLHPELVHILCYEQPYPELCLLIPRKVRECTLRYLSFFAFRVGSRRLGL